MPKSDPDFVETWKGRITAANQDFTKWQGRFRCKQLDRYYEGLQWHNLNQDDQGFVLNMIYSTWKTKKPALLFKEPRFQFSPIPSQSDWDVESASIKAKTATNLVNTLVGDSRMEFAENAAMCLLDSGPYFGVMEIGYSADWIMNPNAGLPEVSSDYKSSESKPKVSEPEQIPDEEWIYVKRIRPERFRIGTTGNPHWRLDKNSWVGYYELIRAVDIKRELGKDYEDSISTPNYGTGSYNFDNENPDFGTTGGYHRVWKIWDLRRKEFFILDENSNKIIYDIETFKRLPLKLLAFDFRRKGPFPMPLFYNWKSAQDDFNESMEQLRAHRRRSKTVYQAPKGLLEQEEKDKFRSLPDGTLIEFNMGIPNGRIDVVPNNSVDNSVLQSVQMSKDNLNIVSGVSSDIRGESDRVTATQASLSAKAGSVREFSEREIVAGWLCEIGLEILELAIEKMALPVWIKLSNDSQEQGTDVQLIQRGYEMINTNELDGFRYRAHVSVDSMSPITNDEQKTKLLEFLAVLNQYPILSMHPTVIRELANKFGYNNENVVQALQQQALQQKMMQEAQMAQAATGVTGGGVNQPNTAQKTVEQMQPPDQGQIENQLASQGVPVQ